MKLAWGTKVSDEFASNVFALSRRFGWEVERQSNDLMGCMGFESALSFSASIKNAAGSGAVGLIQFMPSTADGLGTSTENLELLSPESQLYYVGEYFKPYARRIHTLSDMYMAILLPKYIGAREGAVLFSGKGTKSYRQNAGLDANSDGSITKAEATARVLAVRTEGLKPANYREVDIT